MNSTTRAACDRCHGQKMKCIRSQRQTKCNRCLASRAECIFSPARKSGRPSANKEPLSPKPRVGITQQCSWQQLESACQPPPASRNLGFASSDFPFELPIPSPNDGFDVIAFNEEFGLAINDHDSALRSFLSSSPSDIAASGTLAYQNHEAFITPLTPFSGGHPSGEDQSSRNRHDSVGQVESMNDSALVTNNIATNQAPQDGTCPLSQLSGTLFARLEHHKRIASRADSNSSTRALEQLAADVLQGSVTFLKIFESFSQAACSASQDRPEGAFAADTATTLQILTAYIRLMQLHHILYSRIRSLVLLDGTLHEPRSPNVSPPDTADLQRPPRCQIPAIFPSLSLGGVSLASFPRFQFKFILQICVHQLGEIEALLGLPASFRVSKEGASSESNGVLGPGRGETALLVWTVMAGIEQPVKEIRSTLAELRELFRGTIQI